MKILVVNAGSSSLKYQFIDMADESVIAKGICERIGGDSEISHKTGDIKFEAKMPMKNHTDAFQCVIKCLTEGETKAIEDFSEIAAIGHRVVQGGSLFSKSVLIDDDVIAGIESINDLAPLHNPAHIQAIRACIEVFGKEVPQVAVFDTAFHQTMPEKSFRYALPAKYYNDYKVRRYGFHGTSHRFVSGIMCDILGKTEGTKIITCHLGNGSSCSAVQDGKVIDTTMGFTPLAGVEMGTRCGDVDPSAVLYIMEKENLTPGQMSDLLNKKSGFLGVTEGYSSDSRDLDSAIGEGPDGEHYAQARLAMDILVQQIKKIIGSYAAEMNGGDAIVFTAGIGENNVALRKSVLSDMEFLGITVDDEANKKAFRQGNIIKISGEDSKVLAYVIPTNEEIVIARDTRDIAAAL